MAGWPGRRPDVEVQTILADVGVERLPDFLVVLADGFKTAWVSTTRYLASSDDLGMHGYLPDDPAMASSLFVLGSGAAAGRDLGTVSMTDIAGSIANRLGLALESEAMQTPLF